MARPKKNPLQELVNQAQGIETPEQEVQESPEVLEVEFDYDLETLTFKRDPTTGFFKIYTIFLNVETLQTHVEVEETKLKSKSAALTKVNDKLIGLFKRGQNG